MRVLSLGGTAQEFEADVGGSVGPLEAPRTVASVLPNRVNCSLVSARELRLVRDLHRRTGFLRFVEVDAKR